MKHICMHFNKAQQVIGLQLYSKRVLHQMSKTESPVAGLDSHQSQSPKYNSYHLQQMVSGTAHAQ